MRRSREILDSMRTIQSLLERLDAAIITRYPDSERAADEYGALRKAVNASASASTLHRQNLISLVNAIDDGADTQTVRAKLCDLLSTLSMMEVRPDQIEALPRHDWTAVFEEVGDEANPRSAWIRKLDEGNQVVQRGYVREFAKEPDSAASTGSQPVLGAGDTNAMQGHEPLTPDQTTTVERPVDDNGQENKA